MIFGSMSVLLIQEVKNSFRAGRVKGGEREALTIHDLNGHILSLVLNKHKSGNLE